ncbi:hypothetical protein [Streptomyces yangpuensis]|uniref:hypothetical protein n=1 Tax=Streptomyces yangpuensis TaxID=1648182 RepID=UPI003812D5C6
MIGTRPLRLALLTAAAALAVGTVSLPSSAFAMPRAADAVTAPAYIGGDSPDPDTGQDTDTGKDAGSSGSATGGTYRALKSLKKTVTSDHPATHIGEAPVKQRPYTTSSSPAVRSSKVVLGF